MLVHRNQLELVRFEYIVNCLILFNVYQIKHISTLSEAKKKTFEKQFSFCINSFAFENYNNPDDEKKTFEIVDRKNSIFSIENLHTKIIPFPIEKLHYDV